MKFRSAVFLCMISLPGWSQITVTQGGVLSITPTVSFYAAGDFTNNGKVLNNGSLFIAGAWTNTGDYEAESGQVTFNGSAPQIINHNAQSFAKLVISGGGQKTFDADITIANELDLQNGILISTNQAKIILSESAKVTGGSATSFVQGRVFATGTGAKFFPVGFNSNYLPLTFTNVSGESPVVGVEATGPNTNHAVAASLVAVSPQWYWAIGTLSGTFAGSPVSLQLNNESFNQPDNIVVAQAASTTEPFQSLGKSALSGSESNGSVTSKDNATMPILTVGQANENPDRSLVVYNIVTPNDAHYKFLKILNIEYYPANRVIVVNRWGDKVFESSGYTNDPDKAFAGEGNTGGLKSLTDGTYYYIIDPGNGDDKLSGFLILKR